MPFCHDDAALHRMASCCERALETLALRPLKYTSAQTRRSNTGKDCRDWVCWEAYRSSFIGHPAFDLQRCVSFSPGATMLA